MLSTPSAPRAWVSSKKTGGDRENGAKMAVSHIGRTALLLCSVSVLAACEKGGNFDLFKKASSAGEVSLDASPATNTSVKLVERDVEAPEVFQASEKGLWDGRPSLGGVWVAHPDVDAPERVIIRNEGNGKFVIGALFKRERDNPGPRFQVSSDAAAALGMLAGAPDSLNVTALLRQEVPETPIAPPAPSASIETLPATEEIATASLDDPIAAAGAALSNVQPVSAPLPAASTPTPTRSKLEKPFVQIGLFSVQQNASNTSVALRNAGILPQVLEEASNGKTYYRVTVGPAPSSADRASLLKKVKDLGYTDAYFVRK